MAFYTNWNIYVRESFFTLLLIFHTSGFFRMYLVAATHHWTGHRVQSSGMPVPGNYVHQFWKFDNGTSLPPPDLAGNRCSANGWYVRAIQNRSPAMTFVDYFWPDSNGPEKHISGHVVRAALRTRLGWTFTCTLQILRLCLALFHVSLCRQARSLCVQPWFAATLMQSFPGGLSWHHVPLPHCPFPPISICPIPFF